MYYIQEADKPVIVARIFNILEIVDDKIILPISSGEVIDDKRAGILVRKIKKFLDKTGCKTVILSKFLKKQQNFVDLLDVYEINAVGGQWLFSVISSKVLDYIVEKENLKKEETNVSILVNNNDSDYIMQNIKNIIRTYKSVNIVTDHIGKFKKFEKDVLEKEGIMITITNNKKKSLVRSKIILNVDFTSGEINKYNIPEEAIIVNLKGNVEINKKRFNGLNINDYEISFENFEEFDYDKSKLYFQKDIYEAGIYKKQPYEYIERKIIRDKVKVIELMGRRTSL